MNNKTIRNNWLISFWVYSFITIFDRLIMSWILVKDSTVGSDFLFSFWIFSILRLIGTYYFAYKQRGVRFLVFIMITELFALLVLAPSIMVKMKNFYLLYGLENPIMNIVYLYKFSTIIIPLIYLTNCWHLYRLNLSIKNGK